MSRIDELEIINNYKKRALTAERKLKEIAEIITKFSKNNIVTLPDFKPKDNYKMIAKQYAKPIKDILQIIQGNNVTNRSEVWDDCYPDLIQGEEE